eukprot:NODE_24416_length_626_cov_1.254509.p1 GENE.NODE_24416_length_626_cov_1.254509~~NODE_24416_length_626_cov_1.254509.p1  ORF type:complete len:200 (-),score=66.11 NODE_24416_length_626_cov_1.254509:27-566(-)
MEPLKDALRLESLPSSAAMKGAVPIVRRLLDRRASVNARKASGEPQGFTALHVACFRGHADLAMVLVDVFDASLVLPAPGGRSPAMLACEAGHEHLSEWLIGEGVPGDLRDDVGCTVLFYASKAGLPQHVSWLISTQRLDAAEAAKDGSTPLQWAASSTLKAAPAVMQKLFTWRWMAQL